MSTIINSFDSLGERVPFDGFTDISASLGISQHTAAVVNGSTIVSPNLGQVFALSISIAGSTSVDSFLRLYGEANVLIAAEVDGLTTLEAELATVFSPYCLVEGSTDIQANLRISKVETSDLELVVDIVPGLGELASYVSNWLGRLIVDGQEIPIVDWTFDEAPNLVGGNLQVTLARPGDRSLITADSVIEFSIGRKIVDMGGSIVWDEASLYTLLSSGSVRGYEFSVAWGTAGPTDVLRVRGALQLNDRLGRTPATDTIFYDSLRQSLTLDDFEALLDSEGRSYYPTLVPIVDMGLYDILQQVLVTRCGFSSFETNIPNYPVNRVDCRMGQGYFESIKGLFGMFEPAVFTDGDVIWLIDTSVVLPAGFPTPRAVAVSEYRTLSLTNAQERLDALLVQYVQQRLDYDYITTRTETQTQTSGEFGTDNYTSTLIERSFREYRKLSHPSVVIRSELYLEKRTTTGGGIIGEIGYSEERYDYDSQNRLTQRTKTEQGRVPALTGPTLFALQDVRTETETYQYAVHPFQPRGSYLQEKNLLIRALIVTDSTNQQLGQDFKQEFMLAYRSGNLLDTMTTDFVDIKSRTELNEPLRDGSVRITTKEVDALVNSIISETREERPGDILINGMSPQQSQMLVFDDENTLRGLYRVDTVHLGELPVNILVPLARRILRARKKKAQTINCDAIGFDPILRPGMVISVTVRQAEALGNFIVLGRQLKGDKGGCVASLSCKEI